MKEERPSGQNTAELSQRVSETSMTDASSTQAAKATVTMEDSQSRISA